MKKLLIVALAAILSTGLMAGSCEVKKPDGTAVTVNLPKPNAYYWDCFNKLTPIPAQNLTRDKVIRLIADLRKSELAKSQCGKDVLTAWEKVRVAVGKTRT